MVHQNIIFFTVKKSTVELSSINFIEKTLLNISLEKKR